MSDSDNSAFYTQTASVEGCVLHLPDGSVIDLKDMIIELSYFEDIYSFSVSGFVMIRDGLGIIEKGMLRGSEMIEINFDKYGNTRLPSKKMIAYTVKDRRPVNMTSEIYKIYFCSVDLIMNQPMAISKSYKGKGIDYIVKDILQNELKTENEIQAIQPTFGKYDYIAPMIRPFEVISELSNYARPQNNSTSGTVGADMFLFENRFGYIFASLNSLMQTEPLFTYRYEQSNLSTQKTKPDETGESDSILSLEYVRSYNTLREVSNGAYSNRFIGVNYTTGQTFVKDFDYLKYLSQINPENGQGVQPLTQGTQFNQRPEGFIRVIPTNSGENTVDYIKTNKGVTPDFYLQETLSLRTSQLTLANHTVLKIVVPGNAFLTVGSTVNILIHSLQIEQSDDNRNLDEVYSGKYLITAARHIIQSSGVYQTVLEISKNSNSG